ncbi:MAG: TlpA disulfide reductase family protein [Solirubrobacteraceae bacterium]
MLAGCGGGTPSATAPSKSAVSVAFKGSPPALAALHAQADKLLHGGPKAFSARVRGLRGFPVVINKWASWCTDCQSEASAFQGASLRYGRQVAFIGIDGKDSDSSATAFLHHYPNTYPSYVDPHEAIARTLQAAVYYPQTVYIDRRGRQVYDHAGSYADAAALEQDIKRYVLR